VQSRLGSAREQATETWDNLEALFQSRVQKALQQIGMPNAEEVRLLTKRVAELNENVKALSAKPARRSAGKATAKAAGKKARRGTRRQGPRASG
jgi:ribosomal protein L29